MKLDLATAVATPTAFLNLCTSHVVRVITNEPHSGTYDFEIRQEAATDYRGNRKTKGRVFGVNEAPCEVVTVHKAGQLPGAEARFRAYWCGYKMKSLQMVVCGTEAPIMLTARMDGCTFGIGSRGAAASGWCVT